MSRLVFLGIFLCLRGLARGNLLYLLWRLCCFGVSLLLSGRFLARFIFAHDAASFGFDGLQAA